MKRKLTEAEKKEIRKKVWVAERAKHPDGMIHVHVADETDDKGEPVVRTDRITEKVVPPGWKPNRGR